jgi:MFS family permease
MKSSLGKVPRTVWTLGFVSMFMDISSEMIHGLLPLFLTVTLGASMFVVGVIEGLSEFTAQVVKVFSGWLSDRLGKRKLLAVIGYGIAALTKPVFPMAFTPYEVLGARFADRIGKGIRGAPRDALIADVTPDAARGAAYGLRQSLDTIGAFVGPLIAIALMIVLAGDIRAVFWWAIVPAVIAVVLLVIGVDDVPANGNGGNGRTPLHVADLKQMGGHFWGVVALGGVFSLARFSEAFLILRGSEVGIEAAFAPLVLVAMNVAYAAVAAPVGALSDRWGRKQLLAFSLVVLVVSDVVLALVPNVLGLIAGAMLWGVHMGFSQGLLAALVADTARPELRGTAFGVFNLATGVALLFASIVAGSLWNWIGAEATFAAGAVFATVCLGGLTMVKAR